MQETPVETGAPAPAFVTVDSEVFGIVFDRLAELDRQLAEGSEQIEALTERIAELEAERGYLAI